MNKTTEYHYQNVFKFILVFFFPLLGFSQQIDSKNEARVLSSKVFTINDSTQSTIRAFINLSMKENICLQYSDLIVVRYNVIDDRILNIEILKQPSHCSKCLVALKRALTSIKNVNCPGKASNNLSVTEVYYFGDLRYQNL